jgi:hypothetical protein
MPVKISHKIFPITFIKFSPLCLYFNSII